MRILKLLRRDLGAQVRISRNLEESPLTKARRAFWAVVYLGKALTVATRWTRRECLGSRVQCDGRVCVIANWAGSETPTLSAEGYYRRNVPRAEIESVLDLKEIRHRFTAGFDFYLANWYGIDVSRRVYRKQAAPEIR